MSRNSKNARRIQAKRDWRGNKPGPKKTQPQHKKRNTWWNKTSGKATAPAKPADSYNEPEADE